MIDITPYIQKLDRLREYMNGWVDFSMYNHSTVVLDLYFSTGFLISTNQKDYPNFEEWLQINTIKQ